VGGDVGGGRGQTTAGRRSWYFASLGSKAGAAKETRVFGLGGFLAGQFRLESGAAIDAAAPALRAPRRRAAAGTLLAFAGCTTALVVITEDARVGGLGVTALATADPYGVTSARDRHYGAGRSVDMMDKAPTTASRRPP
jgi:hypothetical protein